MTMRMAPQSKTSARMVALGAGFALLASAGLSRAEEVSATGKGIAGGALLGAEAVTLGEAAFRVNSGWAYLIGGVVGAGGGAALGYVAEQNADPKVSVYLLAGGLALVVPTTVAVLNATSYTPPDEYTTEERALPAGTPVSEPAQPGMSPAAPAPAPAVPATPATTPATPAAPSTAPASPPTSWNPVNPPRTLALRYHWQQPKARMTPGLLAANEQGMRFSVPAVEVRPVYSPAEIVKFGVTQQQELRLTVFSAVF